MNEVVASGKENVLYGRQHPWKCAFCELLS